MLVMVAGTGLLVQHDIKNIPKGTFLAWLMVLNLIRFQEDTNLTQKWVGQWQNKTKLIWEINIKMSS
jgi:hypothetical protein